MTPADRQDDVQKELRALAPGFPEKPEAGPPEGYFRQLPDRVITRWKQEQSRHRRQRLILLPWVSAVAVITGLVLGFYWWNRQDPATTALAGITSPEAYEYVQDHIHEFEALLDQQAQWAEPSPSPLPESAEIQEYLIDEMQGEDIEQLF